MIKLSSKAAQATRKNSTVSKSSPQFVWRPAYNLIFLLIPLIALISYIDQVDHLFPIKRIHLSGSFDYIEQASVESELEELLGQGFFSIDIHQLQKQLRQNSWVDTVSVRRIWPHQLKISVIEKVPVARWDDKHLLSNKAVVFKGKANEFKDLPLIFAANAESEHILNRYKLYRGLFQQLNESVYSVKEDSRGAIDIRLADGLEIKLGRSEVEKKLSRLMTIYDSEIKPRRDAIERLDLRYSNGFAVAWKADWIKQQSEAASIWSNKNV